MQFLLNRIASGRMSLLPAVLKSSSSDYGPLPDLGMEPPWQTGLPRELVTGWGAPTMSFEVSRPAEQFRVDFHAALLRS